MYMIFGLWPNKLFEIEIEPHQSELLNFQMGNCVLSESNAHLVHMEKILPQRQFLILKEDQVNFT